MKTVVVALAMCVTLVAATPSDAHSKTNKTLPADGAVLDQAPDQIDLSFTDSIRLIKVEATRSGGDTQALDLEGHDDFSDHIKIIAPDFDAGVYTIDWRGLGVDGHPMSGQFSFTVK